MRRTFYGTPYAQWSTDHVDSKEYEPIHPPDAITTNLKPEKQSV